MTIAFASKLAPTRLVYNAKRFSVGAHVFIKYVGVPPPAAHRSCGSELAREEASADTKNRASGQSLSRASSLPQDLCNNAKRFSVGAHVFIKYVGVPPPAAHRSCGSLLAKRPVQTQKTGRLDNRFREQAPTKPAYNAKRF
ncbi:hypothetical protein, partial [Pseudomonas sp. SZ57]|uniref:hypothetical protein n=1 Tax=Pseudomonas sp. SZ57 TaxID=2662259 RepID=UPI001C499B7D